MYQDIHFLCLPILRTELSKLMFFTCFGLQFLWSLVICYFGWRSMRTEIQNFINLPDIWAKESDPISVKYILAVTQVCKSEICKTDSYSVGRLRFFLFLYLIWKPNKVVHSYSMLTTILQKIRARNCILIWDHPEIRNKYGWKHVFAPSRFKTLPTEVLLILSLYLLWWSIKHLWRLQNTAFPGVEWVSFPSSLKSAINNIPASSDFWSVRHWTVSSTLVGKDQYGEDVR